MVFSFVICVSVVFPVLDGGGIGVSFVGVAFAVVSGVPSVGGIFPIAGGVGGFHWCFTFSVGCAGYFLS